MRTTIENRDGAGVEEVRGLWTRVDNGPAAFTLIELLVVIAIVAGLASLLLPALARAKTTAQSVKCRSNQRQMGLATSMYVADFGAYHRGLWTHPGAAPWGYWVDQLQPYTGHTWTNELYRCAGNPLRRALTPMVSRPSAGFGGVGFSFAPETDYSINDAGAGGGGIGFATRDEAGRPQGYVFEAQVVSPSQMLAIGDSVLTYYTEWANRRGGGPYHEESPFSRHAYVTTTTAAHTPERVSAQARRHNGRFNVVFCDGHVESLKTNQLFGSTARVLRRWNRDHELY